MAELAGVMVGNYFLLERLSHEGIVETYRARPTTMGGYDVILRLYRPHFPDPTGFRDAFATEVEKVWRCQHPHIQPLLEYGVGGNLSDLLYSVSLLPEGTETLEAFLKRQPDRLLPLPLVMRFVTQLCSALQYAHEHDIVHGNIQPACLLLSGEEELLVTNFSMRRMYQDGDPLMAEIDMGNPAYMAPEQSLGIALPASDIYAVGVLLFHLLSGQLPYDGDSAEEIAMKHTDEPIPSLRAFSPDLSEALELVVRVALSKNPDARFPDAAGLAQALVSAVVPDAPQIISDMPGTPERRVRVRARRTRFTWARAASMLALAVLLLGLASASIFVLSFPQQFHQLSKLPTWFHSSTTTAASTASTIAGTAPPGTTLTPTVESTGPGSGTNGTGTSKGAVPVKKGTPPARINKTPTPALTPTPPGAINPKPTVPPSPTVGPSTFTCAAGSFSIDTPLNLAPLLQQINSDYLSACSGSAITLGGSTDRKNLNAVKQNQATFAASELTAPLQRKLTDHPFAASLYTVIASSNVQISGLSSAQIQGIYQGQFTNWSQLGGPNEPIIVIFRPTSDAVNAIFRSFVLDGAPVHVRGYRLKQDTPNLVVQAVSEVPGAISIVPLIAVQGAHVQVLAINSVLPGAQNLLNGSYAFWGVDHLYTQGTGTAQAQSYLQFVAGGQEADVMVQLDAVPVSAIAPSLLASHLPGPEI